MKSRVYIETSIPSFYHQTRTEPEMLVRQQWTREWWDDYSHEYSLVTSVAVLDELDRGDHPAKDAATKPVTALPLIAVEEAVTDIVQAYKDINQEASFGFYFTRFNVIWFHLIR